MANLFSNVGDRIKIALTYHNLKQAQLSRDTGLSANAISSYVNNIRIPDTEAVYKIAKSLETNIEWLLTGEGEMIEEKPFPVRKLTPLQREVAEDQFENLTEDQVSLINSYEKLDTLEKKEIWTMIKFKLSNKPGLCYNSQTSKNEAG